MKILPAILLLWFGLQNQTFCQNFPVPATSSHSGGTYSIYRSAFNNSVTIQTARKLVIWVEGFEVSGAVSIEDNYNILNQGSLAANIHAAGYDIAVLNFNNASDQIQRNARVLKDLIVSVNLGKSNTDPLVIIGYSMGGLVARYALVEMENQNIAHQTRLYISYDTPHKGAHVPASVQSLALTFDSPTFRLAFPDLAILLDRFKSPAALQMLKYRVTSPNASQTLHVSPSHISFMNELDNLNANGGFPTTCQSVALSLGSWSGVPQRANFDADGDGANDFQYSGFPSVFINFPQSAYSGPQAIWQLNGCQAVAAFSFQSFLSTSSALNYPYLSSRSGYLGLGSTDFATFLYRNSTNTTLLPLGSFSTIVNYNNAEPIDFAPGSLSNTYQQVVNTLNSQINCSFAYYNNSTFVPTVSALAFNSNDLFYKIGDDVNRLSGSRFADMFAFCGDNRSHTNFIATNSLLVQWVMSKINNQVTAPCYCGTSSLITGPSLLCSTATPYNIQNLPTNATVNWSSSNPSGLSINPTTGVATRVNNYNGPATITASVNGGCGAVTLPPFNVWVGNPPANNTTLIWIGTRGVNPVATSPGASYIVEVDQVATATSYTWSLPPGTLILNGGPSTTAFPSIYITTPTASGTYSISCRANNACGSSFTRNLTINNGTSGGGNNCPPGFTPPCRPGGPAPLRVFPNPSSTQLTVSFTNEGANTSSLMNPSQAEDADSDFDAKLYYPFGELARSGKSKQGNLTFDILSLPDGLYVLKVSKSGEVITRQIAIKH